MKSPWPWLILGFVGLFILPPVIFLGAALADGLEWPQAIEALAEIYTASKQNLAVLSGLGLAPLVLVGIVLLIMRRVAPESPNRPIYAAAGVLPILAIQAWVHSMYWPLFFPEQKSPGFPHGLELVIGPFVFAPVAALAGLLLAGLVLAYRRRQRAG